MNIKKILFLLLVISSSLLHAEECNEFAVSFMVDGVDKWKGLSTTEIVQRENEINASSSAKGNDKGIELKVLISPYAKKGTLIVYACGGKSKSFEVTDLLSGVSEKSDLFLTLSKKGFFKLVNANNSKPMLKKVYQLKLVNT